MIISLNGRLMNDQEASISVYDHGFLYGLGLFETFRTYGGHPFLLDEHLRRLHEGCEWLAIPYTADNEDVRQQIGQLLSANGLRDAYIRYSVSLGSQGLGLASELTAQPTVVIYVKPLPEAGAWYETGRAIQLLETLRPIPETKHRLKSFQYMNGWLAKQELRRYAWAIEAGAEGVQLNERGELTEGIVSNLFLVKDGTLRTPSLASGALPGVTRSLVIRMAASLALAVEEGLYEVSDLLEADEVFLTNSIQEIVPVCEVYRTDGSSVRMSRGAPGPVTQKLMARYREVCRSVQQEAGR